MSQKNQKASWPIFGYQPAYGEAELVLLAVPWSATAVLGGGAENGPRLIAQSSSDQIDFFSKEEGDINSRGIHLKAPPSFLSKLNRQTRDLAKPIIVLEDKAPGDFPAKLIQDINQACRQMVEWVYEETQKHHQAGKLLGLVGGDHSISEGALRFLGERHRGNFGILHIDAHPDLMKSYQGFEHSHASVMYNVLQQAFPPQALVQVGVRDYCEEEFLRIQSHKNLHTHFDSDIKTQLFEGKSWQSLVDQILKPLPQKVYISLDVDGLCPSVFPHTGTPVPGGLSFDETWYLLKSLFRSGREIISFDLVEVADPLPDLPSKANSSVLENPAGLADGRNGARLLYFICQQWLACKKSSKGSAS